MTSYPFAAKDGYDLKQREKITGVEEDGQKEDPHTVQVKTQKRYQS